MANFEQPTRRTDEQFSDAGRQGYPSQSSAGTGEVFNDYQAQTFGGGMSHAQGNQEWKNPGPSGGMGNQGRFGGGQYGSNQGEFTTDANDFGNAGQFQSSGRTTDIDFVGTGTYTGQFQSSGRNADEFGSTGVPKTGPSLGDKVLGQAEKFVGKATKKQDMMDRGTQRSQTGHTDGF